MYEMENILDGRIYIMKKTSTVFTVHISRYVWDGDDTIISK